MVEETVGRPRLKATDLIISLDSPPTERSRTRSGGEPLSIIVSIAPQTGVEVVSLGRDWHIFLTVLESLGRHAGAEQDLTLCIDRGQATSLEVLHGRLHAVPCPAVVLVHHDHLTGQTVNQISLVKNDLRRLTWEATAVAQSVRRRAIRRTLSLISQLMVIVLRSTPWTDPLSQVLGKESMPKNYFDPSSVWPILFEGPLLVFIKSKRRQTSTTILRIKFEFYFLMDTILFSELDWGGDRQAGNIYTINTCYKHQYLMKQLYTQFISGLQEFSFPPRVRIRGYWNSKCRTRAGVMKQDVPPVGERSGPSTLKWGDWGLGNYSDPTNARLPGSIIYLLTNYNLRWKRTRKLPSLIHSTFREIKILTMLASVVML